MIRIEVRKALTLVLSQIILPAISLGQDFSANYDNYQLRIKKASREIIIDGNEQDVDWQLADRTSPFHRVLPIDSGLATTKSEVRMTYDDKTLYFLIICYKRHPTDYVVESLRRDWSFGKNDNYLIFIDTYNDQTNGFSFGANVAGAQWDGLMENGAAVNLNWDNSWHSKTVNYDDRWVTEMAVPFRILRYKPGVDKWGINFGRLDVNHNEKSSWAPVPRQFPTASLAFTGSLIWDKPPPAQGTKVVLVPYGLGSIYNDYEGGVNDKIDGDIGLDAKISITPTLNLDLTLNPDFSQVEVDQQVLNLSRFEIFFPERRQFFLENNDLFSGYGTDVSRPFFSRRIGLTNPILAGMKLSGKLNRNWRTGFLNMQTGRVDSINSPSSNFTVATLQRQIFSRSNLSAIFINKEGMDLTEEDKAAGATSYNRIVGLDYNLASSDNIWLGKIFYHHSFTPDVASNSSAHGVNLACQTQVVNAQWNHEYIGEHYNAEVGFVPRTGYFRMYPSLGFRFYQNSEVVNWHGPGVETNFIYNEENELTDKRISGEYALWLLNTTKYFVSGDYRSVLLDRDFDPTNTGGDSLRQGTTHRWTTIGGGFESDKRKLLTCNISGFAGTYYNGKIHGATTELTYRFQPYGSVTILTTYNNINLPDPYRDARLWLVGPKFNLTFTDKVFLSTFVQFNNQTDNLNVNVRFQWRFKPVSDFFIVYSDNYTDAFTVKNRALVAKLSYWFAL